MEQSGHLNVSSSVPRNSFAEFLHGVFSGLLGQFTSVTYPRNLEHVTRDAQAAWSARSNKV